MARVLKPETESGHRCVLPWRRGGYGDTGLPDGTVAVCEDCEQAWFAAPCFGSLGPTQQWRRVQPWHFRLRRRVREAGGSDV